MKIDRALLLHLEALARLELGETERVAMAADLTRILDYAESLSLAPDGGAGAAAPAPAPLREDLPGPSLPPAALRALAPRWEAGHFLVPPVLARADRELCFSRIRKDLVMSNANLHFPKADTAAYRQTWAAGVRCAVMQGGQGDVKHWAFNDPPRRAGKAPLSRGGTGYVRRIPPYQFVTVRNLRHQMRALPSLARPPSGAVRSFQPSRGPT